MKTTDPDYKAKVFEAVYAAVTEASRDPGANTPIVRTGDATLALIEMAALLVWPSSECATPAKRKHLCNEAAEHLRRHIEALRSEHAPYAV